MARADMCAMVGKSGGDAGRMAIEGGGEGGSWGVLEDIFFFLVIMVAS